MRLLPATVALILSACLALPGTASSQTIRGAGARPCTEWSLARRDGGRDYEAEQWALGYVSGAAASQSIKGGRQLQAPAESALFADLDTYCAAHPAVMLWTALVAVAATPHGA
jgi:hypothetical protein